MKRYIYIAVLLLILPSVSFARSDGRVNDPPPSSLLDQANTWNKAQTFKDAITMGTTLLTVEAADGQYRGTTIARTVDAGAASTAFGQAYFIAADGELEPADADATTTMPVFGLATATGTGSKTILIMGTITETDWNWTPGQFIYASTDPTTTSGVTNVAPSGSGDQVQVLGVALTADTILFDPSPVLVEVP